MDILFDWDEILNMQGNSGPYMQYTYVRCQSVLSKVDNRTDYSALSVELADEELQVLMSLNKYPDVVLDSSIKLCPNLLTNYLYYLAQQYNLFYQKHPILKADEEVRNFRLAITAAVAQVIKNGLYLLGIQTVEKM